MAAGYRRKDLAYSPQNGDYHPVKNQARRHYYLSFTFSVFSDLERFICAAILSSISAFLPFFNTRTTPVLSVGSLGWDALSSTKKSYPSALHAPANSLSLGLWMPFVFETFLPSPLVFEESM
jgi:hypothetical protein